MIRGTTTCSRWIFTFALAACFLLALPSAPRAESDPVSVSPAGETQQLLSERDQMILRMVQLAQSGRVEQARDTLDDYLRDHPADGTMHYNLACLEVFLGQPERALDAVEQALRNGYTNFRLIESDSDLGSLHNDPRFTQMVADYEAEFRREFQARALFLDEGYPLEGITLSANDPDGADPLDSPPEVTVGFDSEGLRVELVVADADYSDSEALWDGGCGALVNLILPMSLDDYDARRYFSFGFHAPDGHPAAMLIGSHGRVERRPLPRMTPEIDHQDGRIKYRIFIPWRQVTPYAPPLDQEMGLNVFYLGAGDGPSRAVFSLMPESRMSFEGHPWRRYVPAHFLDSDRTGPVLRGRLYNRLCESDSLGFQLALWSEAEGPIRARYSLHGADDKNPPVREPVERVYPGETELNFLNEFLPLADLPAGSYRLRAEITAPDGHTHRAEFSFENFEAGWIGSLNERVHDLVSPEQSILKYHLFALSRKLDIRHPEDDASALHAARAAVEEMVARCESGESCLPERGLFRGGFESEPMVQRFCSMYLPDRYRDMESPEVLVVLPPEPGSEDDLASSLGKALEGRTEAIVLVPQSHGNSSLATEKSAAHTALALEWAEQLFHCGAVTLIGLGQGADAALEASLRRPELCREILLDGDHLYRDMESFGTDGVLQALGSRRSPRPYWLASGSTDSERQAVLTAALAQLDFQVRTLPVDARRSRADWLSDWLLNSR